MVGRPLQLRHSGQFLFLWLSLNLEHYTYFKRNTWLLEVSVECKNRFEYTLWDVAVRSLMLGEAGMNREERGRPKRLPQPIADGILFVNHHRYFVCALFYSPYEAARTYPTNINKLIKLTAKAHGNCMANTNNHSPCACLLAPYHRNANVSQLFTR